MKRSINEDNLVEALEDVIEKLQKEKKIPANLDKHTIAQNVIPLLKDSNETINLTPEKLENNPSIKKSVIDKIFGAVAKQLNPSFKLLNAPLFDKDLSDEQKKQFKEDLKHDLNLLNNLHPETKLTPEEVNQQVEEFYDHIMEDLEKDPEKSLSESNKAVDTLLEITYAVVETSSKEDPLANLYGGANPSKPDITPKPVLSIVGNLAGIGKKSATSDVSMSAIDVESRAAPGQEDPTGAKNAIHVKIDAFSGILDDTFDQFRVFTTAPQLTKK